MTNEKLIKEIVTLNERINTMSDDTAKHRRWLRDMLYNLDDDNVPRLKEISKLVSDNGKALSLFKQEVDETYATIESLTTYKGEVTESLASISQEASETYATIESLTTYQSDTNTALSAITQTVNATSATAGLLTRYTGAAGVIEINNLGDRTDKTKIYKYVSGGTVTYYYHNGTSWVAMDHPPQSEMIASIATTASSNEASIALVVGEDKLVGTDGATNAASIVLAINESESSVQINADHLSFSGKTFDLTTENIAITSEYFSVTKDGVVSATGATISGNITMTGGSISWTSVTAPSYTNITGTKPPTDADNTTTAVGAKLTYIDAFGIYTGSLTAEQIITGNLSADRIGPNNGNYITFTSPLYLNATYPQIYGLNALYFGGPSASCHIRGNEEIVGLNTIRIYASGGIQHNDGLSNYRILTTKDAVFQ